MGFPEQLKKARKKMNYTQQQIADKMGITKSTYCGYETGKRQPDVKKIKQLAEILNTSGDILLETNITVHNNESRVLEEIAFYSKDLSKEEQLYILDLIKTYQKHHKKFDKS
ncbi:MAG: helix-turn-helix transcriptional regulator [Lachnospiraceae bacterium]|nr:helix-turn-helix transcriptional regulator [Lachnospiraceae bacterium]